MIRIGLVIVLVAGAAMILLILSGVFDPNPAGVLIAAYQPGIITLREEGVMTLKPDESPLVDHQRARYSVRLTAGYVAGATDSSYGLSLGNEAGKILFAVSPLGEAAIWIVSPGEDPAYWVPWQSWPHVRQGKAPNEIRLDIEQVESGTRVTARINRELFWRGSIRAVTPQAAPWLAGYSGPVTVDFTAIEWFAELPASPIGFAPTE